MPEVTLDLIFEHLKRVLAEQTSLRDDMRVLTAMILCVDHGQSRMSEDIRLLTDEVRAMHQQHTRFDDRLRAVEEARS